jgi:hypothetical protein
LPAAKKSARPNKKQKPAAERGSAVQAKTEAAERGSNPVPAGPIGAMPVSQAHKQAMAVDAGRVVGNRGLAQMIGTAPAGKAPAVQRIGLLGPMVLSSALATREGVDRETCPSSGRDDQPGSRPLVHLPNSRKWE